MCVGMHKCVCVCAGVYVCVNVCGGRVYVCGGDNFDSVLFVSFFMFCYCSPAKDKFVVF